MLPFSASEDWWFPESEFYVGRAGETTESPWWGKAETLRTNITHTTVPWRTPEAVWPHVHGGRVAETCKEFLEQNRSSFLLTSTSGHLSA